ncbi:hypothetical protein [Micromonospora endophytica]|uniref:Uncharacterized protein n=1 Tax=Micromonospora endophytica TaxID=515350 RepID=A0A2W2DFZ1_9ACTN|nr:hypothetical protein [Micromonospora endophytica]PZF96056.1 hypothetical protein C1I93_14475 [Micromonospora endophytica]RIW45716.1 hypothetical protein D3H59_14480 [Micromonospora endophytica]BCJ58862.1 hypothetical protein Jiend_22840 [Micromonospora endophytica]
MRIALSAVLLDVPRAAVIWLSLLGVIMLAVAILALRPRLLRFDAGARIRDAALPSPDEHADRQRDQDRWAGEVAVATDRAEATARRRRDEWLTAQDEAEQAWQAYEAAEANVRRLADAAAMPLPQTPRTPAEYAERERWLHRAALDAYWRRELSVEQLSDVFAHRGWDPRLHPVQQELMLHRAVRDHLFARQQAAREREQAAWRAAELAGAAAHNLREEMIAALLPPVEERESVLPLVGFGDVDQTRDIPAVAIGRAPVPA